MINDIVPFQKRVKGCNSRTIHVYYSDCSKHWARNNILMKNHLLDDILQSRPSFWDFKMYVEASSSLIYMIHRTGVPMTSFTKLNN